MNGVIADTQAVLYWLGDDPALPEEARELIGDGGVPVYVSAASVWEAAVKAAKGKLELPDEDLPAVLERGGFDLLPITARDGWSAGALPPHHADPFDRMIIAQAKALGFPVITGDRVFADYEVEVLW